MIVVKKWRKRGAWVGKRLFVVKITNFINFFFKKESVPEFIQIDYSFPCIIFLTIFFSGVQEIMLKKKNDASSNNIRFTYFKKKKIQ